MKVIAINGSPKKDGNTAYLLEVMAEELALKEIGAEIIHIGKTAVRGCLACSHCAKDKEHLCVQKDDPVNEVSLKLREADGFILGAPTYYAGIPGTMKSFLDRIFYSSSSYFRYKVATTAVAVRRTGGLDVQHQLENFLALAGTITPPSRYWRVVYGRLPKEAAGDEEGIQTVRSNARDMAWLLTVIKAAAVPFPAHEPKVITNFIR